MKDLPVKRIFIATTAPASRRSVTSRCQMSMEIWKKLCRSPTVLCTVTVGGAPVKNIAIIAKLPYLMSEL